MDGLVWTYRIKENIILFLRLNVKFVAIAPTAGHFVSFFVVVVDITNLSAEFAVRRGS